MPSLISSDWEPGTKFAVRTRRLVKGSMGAQDDCGVWYVTAVLANPPAHNYLRSGRLGTLHIFRNMILYYWLGRWLDCPIHIFPGRFACIAGFSHLPSL